ncbi:hypothetical protein LCGC14_1513520 [marine sediment metagenome]|uniref:DUF1353 domain-containing protein n=1 Tax=marine sediment metagenome TaxID=412755 RepID=A0A0F9LGB1_9ZZZZ
MEQIGKPLWVEILSSGRAARLLRAHIVRIRGREIIVSSGFETDFASVPRLFWRVVPPWGKYSPAAVVHDFLYATGETTRKEADKIFLKYMKLLGVKPWRRKIMYRAVRMGGSFAWQKHRIVEKEDD